MDTVNTIEDIFKAELKDPFHYKLSITDLKNNNRDIFESMRKIYMTGLVIHYGNIDDNTVDITSLNNDKIDKINKYMLSIGIKANYKVYTASDIDLLYRKFIYEIENFKDLEINTVVDWKTQFIKSIKLNIVNNNKEILTDVHNTLSKHTAANYFLKMQSPKKLEDYAILVTVDPIVHVINFEFAKIGDYDKSTCGQKHKKLIKHFRE